MIKNKQNHISLLLVLLFGFVLFYVGTDGFRAFTAESARRYELTVSKPTLPPVTLEDSRGQTFSLNEFAKGKYLFLTFMYTSCTTVCPILEMNMAEVNHLIPSKYLGKDIVFLSISFDPARDDPKKLAEYSTRFKSDGESWRMARIKDQGELDKVLKKLGVIVIPDGNGNFTHNTAFYLIGKDGHLLKVMDFTKTNEAANTIAAYLDQKGRD
jgi:protein SCO1